MFTIFASYCVVLLCGTVQYAVWYCVCVFCDCVCVSGFKFFSALLFFFDVISAYFVEFVVQCGRHLRRSNTSHPIS